MVAPSSRQGIHPHSGCRPLGSNANATTAAASIARGHDQAGADGRAPDLIRLYAHTPAAKHGAKARTESRAKPLASTWTTIQPATASAPISAIVARVERL